MIKNKTDKEWVYAATRAFVARYTPTEVEIRRVDNGEWNKVEDPHLTREVLQDGQPISKEHAETLYQKFRKRHQDFVKREK